MNESNIRFAGMYSAIFSVYDENMNVKRNTVEKLVEYQLQNGLKGFYVCGNTGECRVLPAKTRKQMLETVIEKNSRRGRVLCHIGATHIDEVFDLIEHANLQEIDAIASLPPSLSDYYNAEETLEYYRMIAKKSRHPVFAYITPTLKTDVAMFADKLMKIPNITGIKLSIFNYYEFGKVVTANGGNINVLNGPDETLICGLAVGAHGGVGTSYNFLPKLACGIFDDFMSGDILAARKGQQRLNDFVKLGIGNNIAYWKSFMSVMGYDMGYTVAPCKMPTKEGSFGVGNEFEKKQIF